MNSPEKLSSAGTTPNKQVRGADRPSDHRGWPPEQPWLKVRTGVAKSPDTCGSHAGIYKPFISELDKLCTHTGHFLYKTAMLKFCFFLIMNGGILRIKFTDRIQ